MPGIAQVLIENTSWYVHVAPCYEWYFDNSDLYVAYWHLVKKSFRKSLKAIRKELKTRQLELVVPWTTLKSIQVIIYI